MNDSVSPFMCSDFSSDFFDPRNRVPSALKDECYQCAYVILAFRHMDEFVEIYDFLMKGENKNEKA